MKHTRSRPPVPRWRRQDVFSKKWFQLRIICYYLVILIGGAAGLSFHLYRYCYDTLRQEMFKGHSTVGSPWEILKEGILAANGIATAVVILLALITTVTISRSVSLAAARTASNLKATVGGTPPRDWDPPLGVHEFRHLHRLFGDAVENHQVRVEELRMLGRLLGEKSRSLLERIEREGGDSNPLLLRDLYVQCEKLRTAYGRFNLKDE